MLAALPPLVPRLPASGQKVRTVPLVGSADALALAQLADTCAGEKRMLVVVSADALAAQRIADELPWFAPGRSVALLPDWETLPYDHFSPHQDLVSQRLATLYHVSRGDCDVLVVAATTALYRLAPPDYLAAFTFFLKQGTRLDVDALRAQLALAGYQHVTQVVSPGEFSVRGGLIDLFPMGSPLPYRVDLFGDDIESIKTFDVDTQRTLYPVPDVRLLPAREFPVDEAGRTRFRSRYREVFEGDPLRSPLYKDVSNGVMPGGIEYYLPLFFDTTATLADYLPRDAAVALVGDVTTAVERFWQDTESRYKLLRGDQARPLLPPTAVFLPPDAFNGVAEGACADRDSCASARRGGTREFRRCRRPALGAGRSPRRRSARRAQALSRRGRHARADLRRKRGAARDDATVFRRIRSRRAARRRLAFVPRRRGRAARSSSRRCMPASRGRRRSSPSSPRPSSTPAWSAAAERDAARRSNVDAMLRDLSEVRIGDPVVHEQHGIGRYLGLVTMDLGEGPAEFLQLVYANDAKLYVSGREPAPDRTLQRRRSRGGASARARQQPVGQGEETRGAAGARHGRRAPQSLRAARGAHRPGVQVQAARLRSVRRGLRLRRDAGPAGGDRGGHRRPHGRQADGPARLRRRRLRQDRGRAARGVRRARRRQAGRGARADDAARRAALPGLLRPFRRSSGEAGRAVALPLAEGGEGRARGTRSRHHRPRDRHAQADPAGRQVQEPRPRHHRRGAPVRRAPEGAAEEAARRGRRADADGDADPAHARDVARGHPRLLGDRHGAAAAARDQDVRLDVLARDHPRGGAARAEARRPDLLPAQRHRHDQHDGGAARAAAARGAHRDRARPDGRARPRARDARVLRAARQPAALLDDHRERDRRADREHDHHRARRPLRPRAAAPAPRPRRPLAPPGVRVPADAARGSAVRAGEEAARGDPDDGGPGRRVLPRDARPRDPRRRRGAGRVAVGRDAGGRLPALCRHAEGRGLGAEGGARAGPRRAARRRHRDQPARAVAAARELLQRRARAARPLQAFRELRDGRRARRPCRRSSSTASAGRRSRRRR